MTAACIAPTCARLLRDHELVAAQTLCDPCIHQLRAWLGAIPNLLIVLRDGSMQREHTGESGGRGGTKESPLPGRPATMNFIGPASIADVRDPHSDQVNGRPVIGTLGDWTQHLLDQHPALHQPRAWTETVLADWLAAQLRLAAKADFAGAMYDEIHDMIYTGLGIARISPRTLPVSRPCPNRDCRLLTLQRRDWDLYVRCTSCGNSYTQSELNDDAPLQLQEIAEGRSAA